MQTGKNLLVLGSSDVGGGETNRQSERELAGAMEMPVIVPVKVQQTVFGMILGGIMAVSF